MVNVDQGGTNVRLDAESMFHNFRAVANVDYLSSYVFRLAFNEVFTAAVNSEVKSQAFLSKTTKGYSYNILTQRYQNFESTAKGDVITILHAPTIDLSSVEHQIRIIAVLLGLRCRGRWAFPQRAFLQYRPAGGPF